MLNAELFFPCLILQRFDVYIQTCPMLSYFSHILMFQKFNVNISYMKRYAVFVLMNVMEKLHLTEFSAN
jgi:hypothetical protein